MSKIAKVEPIPVSYPEPNDFNALFNLTMELFESGQAGEARRYGERFVATAPPAFFAQDIARIRERLAGGRF